MRDEILYIRRLIAEHALDMSDLTVITEIASGLYLYTPFIAALAGSKRVYAIAKDNRYASAVQCIEEGKRLAQELCLDNICFAEQCTDEMLATCDILTNMSSLRPINESAIAKLPSTAVIPYMFETWEYRESDLDLTACQEYGILTMGVNENHRDLRLIDKTNSLAILKTLLDHGFSIYDDRYLMITHQRILEPIKQFFLQNDVSVDVINAERPDMAWIQNSLRNLEQYDAVIVYDLASNAEIVGEQGLLPLRLFRESKRVVPIFHFAGAVSSSAISDPHIRWIPDRIAKPGFMSMSINIVGYKPTLKLTFAGLWTGEIMARLRRMGHGCRSIIRAQEPDSLLQPFSKELLDYAD